MASDIPEKESLLGASSHESSINEDSSTLRHKESRNRKEALGTEVSGDVIKEALFKLEVDLEEIKTQIKIKKVRLADAVINEEFERASDIKIMLGGLKASEVDLQDKLDALGGGLSNLTPQKENLNPRSQPVSQPEDGPSPISKRRSLSSSSDTRSESLDPDDPSVINTESAEARQEGVPLVERIKLQYRTPDGQLKERYKRRAHTDLFYWDTEVMPKSEYVRRKFQRGHLAETMYNFSIDTHTPVAVTWIDPCTDVVHYAGAGECLDFLNIPEDRAVEWQPPNHPQSGKMSSEFCRNLPFNRVEKPRKKGALKRGTSQVKHQWKISDLSLTKPMGASKRSAGTSRETSEPSEVNIGPSKATSEPPNKISKPSKKKANLTKKNVGPKIAPKKIVSPSIPVMNDSNHVPFDPIQEPENPAKVPDDLNLVPDVHVQNGPIPIPDDPTLVTDNPTQISENTSKIMDTSEEKEEHSDESIKLTPVFRKSRGVNELGARLRGQRGGVGRGIIRESASHKVQEGKNHRGGAGKGITQERGARGARGGTERGAKGVRGGQGRGRASHTNDTPVTRPIFSPPTIGNKESIQLFGLFKTAVNNSDNEP